MQSQENAQATNIGAFADQIIATLTKLFESIFEKSAHWYDYNVVIVMLVTTILQVNSISNK